MHSTVNDAAYSTVNPRGIQSLTTTLLCHLGLWDFEEKKFEELKIYGEEDMEQVHCFESTHNPVRLRKKLDGLLILIHQSQPITFLYEITCSTVSFSEITCSVYH